MLGVAPAVGAAGRSSPRHAATAAASPIGARIRNSRRVFMGSERFGVGCNMGERMTPDNVPGQWPSDRPVPCRGPPAPGSRLPMPPAYGCTLMVEAPWQPRRDPPASRHGGNTARERASESKAPCAGGKRESTETGRKVIGCLDEIVPLRRVFEWYRPAGTEERREFSWVVSRKHAEDAQLVIPIHPRPQERSRAFHSRSLRT